MGSAREWENTGNLERWPLFIHGEQVLSCAIVSSFSRVWGAPVDSCKGIHISTSWFKMTELDLCGQGYTTRCFMRSQWAIADVAAWIHRTRPSFSLFFSVKRFPGLLWLYLVIFWGDRSLFGYWEDLFRCKGTGWEQRRQINPLERDMGLGPKIGVNWNYVKEKNRMNPWHVLSTNWMLFWTLTRSDWHSLQGLGLGTWMLSVSSFYLLLAVINVMRGIRVKRNLAVPLVSIEYTLEIYSMPLRRWRSNTINAHNPSINKHK